MWPNGRPSQLLLTTCYDLYLLFYWATVCKTVRPMLSDHCPVLSCLSVGDIGVLWPNGWTDKMKVDMQVGLGPGHIALDGDPAPPPPKGHNTPPVFGPYLLRPNACMDQNSTWYGGRPRPRRLCVRWGPSPPSQKGGPKRGLSPLPNFRPLSIVAKRLDESRCHLVRR